MSDDLDPEAASYQAEESAQLMAAAGEVVAEMDADILFINSPMWSGAPDKLFDLISTEKRKSAVFVILVTLGGDPHAAYVMARALQRAYEKGFDVCIAGDCYSAGTLFALGANTVVMSERGRLGPLDVQLLKKDTLGERLSGLTLGIALDELNKHAYKTFKSNLYNILSDFNNLISLRTAMDIAARMSTESFSEVYRQIDPVKLGEDARSLHIADHYGKLLQQQGQNLKEDALRRLLQDYPSHDCIIDCDEAKELFFQVGPPSEKQAQLLGAIGPLVANAVSSSQDPFILYLNPVTPREVSRHEKNT